MTKSEIIQAIFGSSSQGQKVEADKKRLSLDYLKRCLDYFNESQDKANARNFIFGLLRR